MTRFLRRPVVLGAALLALFAIPFVIIAVNFASPRPYVVLDWAQTEMRVRAVFSHHPPLIGLPGRIGHFGVDTGSHPGPLSFYLLAPFYGLFGRTPWALLTSALALNLTWIGVGLWVAFRRAGRAGMVVYGVGMLALVHGLGVTVVDQPWNPYLPLMVWPVVLLAAWSVLLEDAPMLPVLAVAATFCMQTHLPYLGLAGGLVGATVVGLVVLVWLRFRALRAGVPEPGSESAGPPVATADPPDVRRLVRWGVVAVVVGVILWLPPVADQIRHSPGNLKLIWDDLSNPPEAAGGLSQGIRLLLVHLNPVELLRGHVSQSIVVHSRWPGAVFLAVWLASVVAAWKLAVRRLLLLDAVIGVALVLALVSLSKIYGDLFWYLMLWAWTLCGLMLVTLAWTVVEAWRRRADDAAWATATRGGAIAASVVAVALCVALSIDGTRANIPHPESSDQVAHIVGPTIRAIEAGKVPGDSGHGPYLLTCTDPVSIGNTCYAMLDELERVGIPVGLSPPYRGIVTDAELVAPGTERGVVHLSLGDADIARWRALPGVVEVVSYDGRTPAQVARYARLRADAIRRIKAVGGDPSVVDTSVVSASLDSSIPRTARTELSEMADIGAPTAVFLAPPGTL